VREEWELTAKLVRYKSWQVETLNIPYYRHEERREEEGGPTSCVPEGSPMS
jgi:hypothetical protein